MWFNPAILNRILPMSTAKSDSKTKASAPRKYVLVDVIQQYRMRYVVELGADDPAEWALDDVVSRDLVEFSQQDLGQTIVSHRVLPGGLPEAAAIARQDNDWLKNQSDEHVYENHVTAYREP